MPTCVGLVFLGISYGIYFRSQGFSFIYPVFMSLFIFAGTMEFLTIGLLSAAFDPLNTLILTLMVNARHLFYGVSLLDSYGSAGWRKGYLIYSMCDESFSLNSSVRPPEGIDHRDFMFCITLLNHSYWVIGSCIGSMLGGLIRFNTAGIEFVLTGLYLVLFVDRWKESKDHHPALVGVGCAAVSLFLFGSSHFILPAMAAISLIFLLEMRKEARA